jgi:nucleoside-diphosphate-sugar epimerase
MTGKILVTGASGFVGSALVAALNEMGLDVRACSRGASCRNLPAVEWVQGGELTGTTDWSAALRHIDVVVHCAARAHVLKDSSKSSVNDFRDVNLHGTLRLATKALESGVRKFVFLSSAGVNGAFTTDSPFTAADRAAPQSPYAVSKYEAEKGLIRITKNSNMNLVIVRPPLVYGPNAPGNFGALTRILLRRMPLPLAHISNKRSFVALQNLVDLLILCAQSPLADHQTFLVSDGEDLSTSALLNRMGDALGKPPILFSVPTSFLKFGALILGKPELAQRLCASFQLDISGTTRQLGWIPPFTVEQGLRMAADGYLDEKTV